MTPIWMGYDTVRAAVGAQRMLLTGNRSLAASMQTRLALSPFARERKLASWEPERPLPETTRVARAWRHAAGTCDGLMGRVARIAGVAHPSYMNRARPMAGFHPFRPSHW